MVHISGMINGSDPVTLPRVVVLILMKRAVSPRNATISASIVITAISSNIYATRSNIYPTARSERPILLPLVPVLYNAVGLLN